MEIINFDKSTNNIEEVFILGGKYDGIQRYDRYVYPITEKLVRLMQANTWFPREINFTKDRSSFNTKMSEPHKEIYKANLLFQTMADSLANRFLDNVLSDRITSPEWESVIKWQAHQELIHSEAYSWNIREVFNDPSKFFNEGFSNKKIQARLNIENACYSGDSINIIDAIIHQYALESIRFFISFLYTFKLNEIYNNTLQGSENNIVLIANDEKIHVAIFKHLITQLKTSREGNYVFDPDKVRSIFDMIIKSEMKWYEYLSSISSIRGMNKKNILEFLQYFSYISMKNIDITPDFSLPEKNELIELFILKTSLTNQRSLAQETDLLSYSISVLDDKEYLNDSVDFDEYYKETESN